MDRPGYRPTGRRAFLGALGLGAAGIVVGAPLQAALDTLVRPFAGSGGGGLGSLLPAASRFRFYSVVGYNPRISDEEYRLVVDGLVDEPLELTLPDLLDSEQVDLTRDFQCVTGWRVPDVPWRGVRVSDLLDRSGVSPGAAHVRFHSHDGVYTTTLALDDARRDDVLVATEMLGGPVTFDHGGPVRLYVAPMYGYKSLKWLSRIEVTESGEPPGYWEERGYDVDAWIGGSNGRSDEPV